MIRVCLIGCGTIARVHLKALKSLSGTAVQVVGLVDPIHESAISLKKEITRHEEECQIFSNIDDANRSLLYDAAMILVPHDLHVDIATKCIQNDKHVFLEKPVSSTLSGCDELLKLAKTTNKVFMIGENSRYWPEVVYAKSIIDKGTIGEVYYGQANYWESIGSRDEFYDGEGSSVPEWTNDKERVGGGALMAGGIHWIRSLRVLLGDIVEVVGFTSNPIPSVNTNTGERLSHSLLKFSNGIPGVLHTHLMNIPMTKIPFFQIFGTKGEISIHGDFNGGITVLSDTVTEHIQSLGGYKGSFEPQMKEFITRINEGRCLIESDGGSVWEGRKDMLVSMAIYKSTTSGKWEPTMY